MTEHARVCIVGGGAMGVGLFYHLALEGWTDIVLVEKGELTSGSTWHAAGQCPHFIGNLSMAHIHYYGTQLYPKLEELTGHGIGVLRGLEDGSSLRVGHRSIGPRHCDQGNQRHGRESLGLDLELG